MHLDIVVVEQAVWRPSGSHLWRSHAVEREPYARMHVGRGTATGPERFSCSARSACLHELNLLHLTSTRQFGEGGVQVTFSQPRFADGA